MTEATVRTEGMRAGYGAIEVLHGLDLHAEPGEIVAILGPNGAGKTTTLLALAGAIPSAGVVELFGRSAEGGVRERTASGLAFLPDQRGVIRALTVLQNLRVAGVDADEAFDISPELRPLKDRRAGDLSGGEQQILALTRAIVSRPRLILVDEISFGLAPIIVNRTFRLLRAMADSGAAVVLVEQFAHLALKYADRAYVLQRGSIAIEGTATDILADIDSVERSYLGGSN